MNKLNHMGNIIIIAGIIIIIGDSAVLRCVDVVE